MIIDFSEIHIWNWQCSQCSQINPQWKTHNVSLVPNGYRSTTLIQNLAIFLTNASTKFSKLYRLDLATL